MPIAGGTWLVRNDHSGAAELFDAQDIDAVGDTYSDGFRVTPYLLKTLLLTLAVTGTPTDIDVWVEFSHDGTTYVGQNSPTEGVRLIDAAGNSAPRFTYTAAIEDVLSIPDWAIWMRMGVNSAGADGSNYFTVTAVLMARTNE